MITCSTLNTTGRLGNQMFIIAALTGIAETLQTQTAFPKWEYKQYFKQPLPQLIGYPINHKVKEYGFHYDPEFINLLREDTDYDLTGYFQSEKYWIDAKDKVLKQFEFTAEIRNKVKVRFAKALKSKTVAISVRRGDFVNNPNYFQIPITYYLNAYYTHFKAHNAIIFSDDIEYCKTHFRALNNVYYADLIDIEQLALMSMCDNHIISNSTFSWWGAYLSNSKLTIRPEKNFSGPLAKVNSEKDYWLPEWQTFKDYRIDLSDTTFIIPVYYDHQDRMQNLMLTLSFLNTHFDTNIILGEQGGTVFEGLSDYAEYIEFESNYFHRTKMINVMAKRARTPIVVNWDSDNICPPAQIVEAVSAIREGTDISYPFDGTVYRVPRCFFSRAAESLDVHSIPIKSCVTKHSSVGHAVVMNKESFIKSGMENEKFISWGPEDSERFERYKILGLTVKRIPGGIYHMDHYRGNNSSCKNEFFADNESEYMKVARKDKQQLTDYIKTWQWVN